MQLLVWVCRSISQQMQSLLRHCACERGAELQCLYEQWHVVHMHHWQAVHHAVQAATHRKAIFEG